MAAIFPDRPRDYLERKLQACNFNIHGAISEILGDENGMWKYSRTPDFRNQCSVILESQKQEFKILFKTLSP